MNHSQDIQSVSNKTLLLATVSAVILALLVFYLVVMPAEFGQDPTGIGKKLGITVLAETEAIPDQQPIIDTKPAANTEFAFREDHVTVVVPANKGIEYKFKLMAFGQLKFEWQTTNDSPIYYDFHGEPEGDTTGYYLSYSIATSNRVEGTATVPFNGIHGWYWKNTSGQPISVSLKTSGNYQIVDLKH